MVMVTLYLNVVVTLYLEVITNLPECGDVCLPEFDGASLPECAPVAPSWSSSLSRSQGWVGRLAEVPHDWHTQGQWVVWAVQSLAGLC